MIEFAILTAALFWKAFALKELWTWFIVPLGLPAIGMAHALGLSLCVGLMTHQTPSEESTEDRTARVVTWALMMPAVSLLVGWVAHWSMA